MDTLGHDDISQVNVRTNIEINWTFDECYI